MRESKTVTIGDVTYEIHQYPATQGLQLGIKLGKLIAPVMAPLAEAKDGAAVTAGSLKAATEALVSGLEVEDTVRLVKDLLSVVVAQGKGRLADIFDAHFSGRLGDLPALLREVIAHNFSDFFSGLVGSVRGANSTTTSA